MSNVNAFVLTDDPPPDIDSSLPSSSPPSSAPAYTVHDGTVSGYPGILAESLSDLTLLCSSLSIAPFVHPPPPASRRSTPHAQLRAIVSKSRKKGKKFRAIRRSPMYSYPLSSLCTHQFGDVVSSPPVSPSHEEIQSAFDVIGVSSTADFNRVVLSQSPIHSDTSTSTQPVSNPSNHPGGDNTPCVSLGVPFAFDIDDFLSSSTNVDGPDPCLPLSDHAIP